MELYEELAGSSSPGDADERGHTSPEVNGYLDGDYPTLITNQ